MKKNKKRLLLALLTGLMTVLLFSTVCYAAETVGGDSWWVRNASILSQNSTGYSLIRWIGWKIICLTSIIASGIKNVYDKTFGLIDVTQYESVNTFLESSKGWLLALTTLCIAVTGIQIMIKKEAPQVFRNIILGILAVSCSLYLFTSLNSMAVGFKNRILGPNSNADLVYSTINDYSYDLIKNDKELGVDRMNAEKGTLVTDIGIRSRRTLYNKDINELLSTDKDDGKDLYNWSDKFQEYISYYVSPLSSDKYVKVKVYNGLLTTSLGNNFYYRYSFDFFSILLQVLAIIVMYIALSYKNIRIAYDLLVSRVLAFFFAADIGGGEKLKAILCFIRDMYITLAISIFSIKIYIAMSAAIDKWDMLGIFKGIVKVCLVYVIIDGPLVSEKILGIDAGLKSSLARAMVVGGAVIGGGKAVAHGTMNGINKLSSSISGHNSSKTQNREGGNSITGGFSNISNGSSYAMSKNQDSFSSSGSPGGMSSGSPSGMNSGPSGNISSGFPERDFNNKQNQTGPDHEAIYADQASDTTNAKPFDPSGGSFDKKQEQSGFESYDNEINGLSNNSAYGFPGNDMSGIQSSADFSTDNNADVSTDNNSTLDNSMTGNFNDVNTYGNESGSGSGYDSSFMNASNSDHSSFINGANNNDSSLVKEQNNEKLSSTTAQVKRDSFNPEFSKAQAMYKPNAPKGSPELRDYNRQITAIVKGKDHAPIPPKDNAPEFKKVNYQNALKVKEAYDKGAKNKSSRKDKK